MLQPRSGDFVGNEMNWLCDLSEYTQWPVCWHTMRLSSLIAWVTWLKSSTGNSATDSLLRTCPTLCFCWGVLVTFSAFRPALTLLIHGTKGITNPTRHFNNSRAWVVQMSGRVGYTLRNKRRHYQWSDNWHKSEYKGSYHSSCRFLCDRIFQKHSLLHFTPSADGGPPCRLMGYTCGRSNTKDYVTTPTWSWRSSRHDRDIPRVSCGQLFFYYFWEINKQTHGIAASQRRCLWKRDSVTTYRRRT